MRRLAKTPTPKAAFAPTAIRPAARVESKPSINGPTGGQAGPQPTREQIAEAAYFLWLKRGGDEVLNWIEAEALLEGRVRARA